jgi:hypothetical protein
LEVDRKVVGVEHTVVVVFEAETEEMGSSVVVVVVVT